MNQQLPTISIIGFGALGALFASIIANHIPFENLRIVADVERCKRYTDNGLVVNGKPIKLNYVAPEQSQSLAPADLVIVCTKFYHLEAVMPLIQSQIGDNTLIVSALNGISSEAVLADAFGKDKVVYSVAQQMDARKEGNQLIYRDAGQLVIGAMTNEPTDVTNVARVRDIFTQVQLPHSVSADMPKNLWGKLMLNTGVNQTVAFYEGTFDTVQQAGEPREMFKAAMREVMAIANAEGVALGEDDFNQWVTIMDNLDPTAMPSLRQDLKAGRDCEVELFAGTIRKLGKKHGIATPVNDTLYEGIYQLMARNDS